MHRNPLWMTFLVLVSAVGVTRADVTLPNPLIGDHMVLQAGVPAPVWGKAEPGEKVTVTLGDHSASTVADAMGQWLVKLGPMKADAITDASAKVGRDLVIAGKNTITVKDVLVGEVWLGSGQSNMVLAVKRSVNGAKEIADADRPMIRLFHIKSLPADEPLSSVSGQWTVCSPKSVPGFSAAAYFFGRDLQGELRVPVGLIQSAVGGTPIGTWLRPETPATQPGTPVLPVAGKGPSTQPGNEAIAPKRHNTCYSSMIAPLTNYALRGVLWYQGEANAGAGRPAVYTRNLRNLILGWRRVWDNPEMTFLTVQLPGDCTEEPTATNAGTIDGWAVVREGQLKSLDLPRVGLIITTDIGQGGLHPPNKQDVGRRLALAAREIAYGQKITGMGPIFESAKVDGDCIRIKFNHVGGGLRARGDKPLTGFAIAGSDRKFEWADARIDGDLVIVSAPKVPKPVAVRYATTRNAACNLDNAEGLPASPFRTDDWPAPTAVSKPNAATQKGSP